MIVGLGVYTNEAPYGYNADGSEIAPYGSDLFGRPRTGMPGVPGSYPYLTAEEAQLVASGEVDIAELSRFAPGAPDPWAWINTGASRPPSTVGAATSKGGSVLQQVQTSARASILNATRPSASYFQPGDRYQVKVSGAPNSPVSVTAQFPNGEKSSTTYGTTDSSGAFSMYGDITDAHLGHWVEVWHVGSQDAPSIAFDVLKAGGSGSSSGGTGSSAGGTGSSGAGGTGSSGNETAPPAAFDLSGFVAENKWLLIGGAAVVAFFMMGRGK